MNEKQIHKQIENNNPAQKEEAFARSKERLYAAYAQGQELSSKPQSARCGRKWLFAVVPACVLVLCLAIVLPLTLRKKDDAPGKEHYAFTGTLTAKNPDCTVREYAQAHSLPWLYLDWYDFADSSGAMLYMDPDNPSRLVYISESMTKGDTGEEVSLFIAPENFTVEQLEYIRTSCFENIEIRDITAKWSSGYNESYVFFTYKEYNYYMIIYDSIQKETVEDYLEQMIP